ncbi:MAG: caspase family protein [Rhodoferax sp.]|nr:caspase family protein [Rhodoferax sp.]
MRLKCLSVVAGLCFSASAQAPLDVRMALVIGNSAYPSSPLVNSINDARAMGDTLRGLGFTVMELRDANKEQMSEAVARMREALRGKQAVGMFVLRWTRHAVGLAQLHGAGQRAADQSVRRAGADGGRQLGHRCLQVRRQPHEHRGARRLPRQPVRGNRIGQGTGAARRAARDLPGLRHRAGQRGRRR